MSCKPLYTTFESVKIRLVNKVQFQSEKEPIEGELPDNLLLQMIRDAETDVEQDLRSRYAIPFRSASRGTYANLPDPTQRALRLVVDLKAVLNILTTDFGRGTHISADGYVSSVQDKYDLNIKRLLGNDKEGEDRDRFRFAPPLDDLLLAKTNSQADDGFKGMIINTDASTDGAESYAEDHINNPARSYVNTRWPWY